jgi:hypothetical protein
MKLPTLIGPCTNNPKAPGRMNWTCVHSKNPSDLYVLKNQETDMSIGKVFLYAEIQVAIPFSEIDWRSINGTMQKEPGLKSKTWLSGINTNTIGGFYEFDSLENAQAYATGYLAAAAKQLGGSLSVKLFNGDITADANQGMSSPFYVDIKEVVPA